MIPNISMGLASWTGFELGKERGVTSLGRSIKTTVKYFYHLRHLKRQHLHQCFYWFRDGKIRS